MEPTFIYVVRHAQTTENLLGIIQGQLDTQLDPTGRLEQAPAVARALKDVPFDACFSSDLTRAVDTAAEILQYHPGVELQKLALLRERDMGNLQGQIVSWRKPKGRPPPDETVESPAHFTARTLRFWDEVIISWIKSTRPKVGRPTGNVLVVGHGAFIATLAHGLIGHRNIKKEPGVTITWCPNVSITRIEVQEDGSGELLGFGDISHITEPAAQTNADALPA